MARCRNGNHRMKLCSVHGCGRRHLAKGLCGAHYFRMREWGSLDENIPLKKRRAQHAGLRQHPLYDVWNDMIRRCTMPHRNSYEQYGGRGITVCERWMSFENFIVDMGSRPTLTHTLDRRDSDGNYEPLNCRWATPQEQGNNVRRNRRLTFDNQTLTVAEWAEKIGINSSTLLKRLTLYGWSVEKA